MTDQEIPSAGAILLAAYFAIDTPTLGNTLKPFFSHFPAVTGAILWNIVKLTRLHRTQNTQPVHTYKMSLTLSLH